MKRRIDSPFYAKINYYAACELCIIFFYFLFDTLFFLSSNERMCMLQGTHTHPYGKAHPRAYTNGCDCNYLIADLSPIGMALNDSALEPRSRLEPPLGV